MAGSITWATLEEHMSADARKKRAIHWMQGLYSTTLKTMRLRIKGSARLVPGMRSRNGKNHRRQNMLVDATPLACDYTTAKS